MERAAHRQVGERFANRNTRMEMSRRAPGGAYEQMSSWVDHKNYVGPDRRKKRGLRLNERREYDYGGNAPSLSAAVRQLRMHVLDAHGPEGAAKFVERVSAVAWLAEQANEPKAAAHLHKIAQVMIQQGAQKDMRNALYPALERVAEAITNAS